MRKRLKQQFANVVRWVKEQVKNNPLGALVAIVFAVWFIVTLVLTEGADRWGFAPKTFWDWLDLLIVPLALALGALWFNASQKRTELTVAEKARETEREIARDRQQQATLEAYYDRMADLLLNHELRETDDIDEERSIARSRTLAVLRSLDPRRKGQVVQFLYESGLINGEKKVVCLRGADLFEANLLEAELSGANLFRANLLEAELSGANLNEANLSRAELSGAGLLWANLVGANLNEAVLSRANLLEAELSGANLVGAELLEANLSRANLMWANLEGAELIRSNLEGVFLSGANLEGANLEGVVGWTPEQLLQAKSLKNATMPDGAMYEEWIKKQKRQQAETDNRDVEKEEEE